METLQVNPSKALEAYKKADKKEKALLETVFGKGVFACRIIDQVKSFEDACAVKGVKPSGVLPFKKPANKDQEAINAFAMMQLIAQVLNDDHVFDWSNSSEYKYFPWFYHNKAGVGFSFYVFACTYTYSDVGSRLCYKSTELAEYAGKQFLGIYKKFMTQ